MSRVEILYKLINKFIIPKFPMLLGVNITKKKSNDWDRYEINYLISSEDDQINFEDLSKEEEKGEIVEETLTFFNQTKESFREYPAITWKVVDN